jgi:FlaA1/EpsC-like NDP-sugar epimerase
MNDGKESRIRRGWPWLPRVAVVTHDLAMVWGCWIGLHWLRYDFVQGASAFPPWSTGTAIVIGAQGLVFWQVGLYRGLWRFASLPDLWNIFKASILGVLAIAVALFVYSRLDQISRAVLLLYPFVLTAALTTPRLLYRAWKDSMRRRDQRHGRRVLVLGAGEAGEALVRDLNRSGLYRPVGFLDDAARLRGTQVQGLPVLGVIDDVERVARDTAAELLVIAMPSGDADTLRRVVAACERTGLPFRTVPRLDDLLEGKLLPGELQEIEIEDVLGREAVKPNWKLMRDWLAGRTVMITGAGGSIGSELCRQCARNGATRLVLVEHSELALVEICRQIKAEFPRLSIIDVLGDCGDPATMAHALSHGAPDAVFHAAAYKHVPMLEGKLREAVRNNVLATECVARSCAEAGVAAFVLISTDKAVDPANVLGASKRMAEMVCAGIGARHPASHFITVRFGNVLDSAGSVVPLFREQIRRGGPVTVTDPEVTRFFMTIPEASQLILQAAAMGGRQVIYTLDMGSPVKIQYVAEQMIRLAGKLPGRDVAIVHTGLRAGEKLHEVLFHADESHRPTSHPKVLRADARDTCAEITQAQIDRLRDAVARYDVQQLAELVTAAVPVFADQRPGHGASRETTVVDFPSREARRTP